MDAHAVVPILRVDCAEASCDEVMSLTRDEALAYGKVTCRHGHVTALDSDHASQVADITPPGVGP